MDNPRSVWTAKVHPLWDCVFSLLSSGQPACCLLFPSRDQNGTVYSHHSIDTPTPVVVLSGGGRCRGPPQTKMSNVKLMHFWCTHQPIILKLSSRRLSVFTPTSPHYSDRLARGGVTERSINGRGRIVLLTDSSHLYYKLHSFFLFNVPHHSLTRPS